MIARLDRLLTPQRMRVYPAALLILFVLSWAASVALRTATFLPDFRARWTAGRMLLDGQAELLYDLAAQFELQAKLGATTLSWFVSPPTVALALTPLGAIPYAAASGLWLTLSLAGIAVVIALLRPSWPANRPGWGLAVLIALASQPMLEMLGAGQDTWIVLLCCLAAWWLTRADRFILAGGVLAGVLAKPQLLPAALLILVIYSGRRALIGFALAAVTGFGFSVGLLGSGAWSAWWRAIGSGVYFHAVTIGQAPKTVSLQGLVVQLSPPNIRGAAAVLGTVLGSLILLAWATWLIRTRPTVGRAMTTGALVTVIAAPHAMIYDAVVVLPACVAIVISGDDARVRVLVAAAFVIAWLSTLGRLTSELPWPGSIMAAPWVVLPLMALLTITMRARQDLR